MTAIDWTQAIEDPSGRKARLLGTLRDNAFPFVVAIEFRDPPPDPVDRNQVPVHDFEAPYELSILVDSYGCVDVLRPDGTQVHLVRNVNA